MDEDNYYLKKETTNPPTLPTYGQTLNGKNGWTRYNGEEFTLTSAAVMLAEYSPIHKCVGAGSYQ